MASDSKRLLERAFDLHRVRVGLPPKRFALQPMKLGFPPPFVGLVHEIHSVGQDSGSFLLAPLMLTRLSEQCEVVWSEKFCSRGLIGVRPRESSARPSGT
jgi:hypothetical protein